MPVPYSASKSASSAPPQQQETAPQEPQVQSDQQVAPGVKLKMEEKDGELVTTDGAIIQGKASLSVGNWSIDLALTHEQNEKVWSTKLAADAKAEIDIPFDPNVLGPALNKVGQQARGLFGGTMPEHDTSALKRLGKSTEETVKAFKTSIASELVPLKFIKRKALFGLEASIEGTSASHVPSAFHFSLYGGVGTAIETPEGSPVGVKYLDAQKVKVDIC